MERYTPPRYGRNINLDPDPDSNPNLSIQVNTEPETNKEVPPGFTYARPTQTNALPIILLILFASPYIKIDKARSLLMDSGIDNHFDDSDTILEILSSIHPFLDPEYQDGINFIFGLSEARTILKSLLDGSYQTTRLLSAMERPTSYQDRAIGIIKALQPYITLENQTLINRILDVNNTLEKLVFRLRKFRQQDIETQDSKGSNLARVMEIIDIIKILIPAEQQQYINQISNILRIVETVELAQLLNAPRRDDPSSKVETETIAKEKSKPPSIEKEQVSKSIDSSDDKPNDKVENMSNVLKTMFNPEQAKSLDMIIKMAQLMAKDSTEKKSAD